MVTKRAERTDYCRVCGRTAGDGIWEVQIAILTARINDLAVITSKLTRKITTQEEDFLRW